jgi:hypothetical protein
LSPGGINNIQSLVKIIYNINLPNKRTIIINNNYGSCSIRNYNGYLNIHNDYGNISLSKIDGLTRVFTTLSKISVRNLSGKSEFDTKNTEYSLMDINGTISINNNIGNIVVKPGTNLESLAIKSPGGEVNIILHDLNKYDFDLQTKYAEVKISDDLNKSRIKYESKKISKITGNNPLINVSTKFNNINIKP